MPTRQTPTRGRTGRGPLNKGLHKPPPQGSQDPKVRANQQKGVAQVTIVNRAHQPLKGAR